MAKTTLRRDELEAVILEAVQQNPVTADVSAVEIVIAGPDQGPATGTNDGLACDWRVERVRRGGRAYFDGGVDHPLETADHRTTSSDADVRRALDGLVASLRARYAVSP